MWGATYFYPERSALQDYFNSHTPCGVRRSSGRMAVVNFKFQLTHPMRGATEQSVEEKEVDQFQLTHPMWGATWQMVFSSSPYSISTHTPHVGCDLGKIGRGLTWEI